MPRVVGILLFCSFVTLSSSHRFLIVVTTGAISTSIFESSSSLHRQSYSDFTNEHLYSFHPGSLIGPGISVCTLSPHFLSGKYSWSAEEEYFLKPLPANECQCYISLRSLLQLIAELPFFFLSPLFFSGAILLGQSWKGNWDILNMLCLYLYRSSNFHLF